MKKNILLFSLICSLQINAQSNRTFFLGHSLINLNIPQMVSEMAKESNIPFYMQRNIGIGANLGWHWTNPYTGQGDVWDTTLRRQTFDHFIITEAVPLKGHLQWSMTYEFLDSFYLLAKKRNPNIQMLFYETWHCINSGTPTGCMYDNDSHIPWRTRLDSDLVLWEGILDQHNRKYPNHHAYMVPGGQGLARLHDEIAAGRLPGIKSHRELFSDDIHLTNIGNYFIACVMYGVIFKKSPVGLPAQLKDMYNVNYSPAPTNSQAAVLQKVAWEAVCNYNRTNVKCNTTNTDIILNPANYKWDGFTLNLETKATNIQVIDIMGSILIQANHSDKIDLSRLSPALYFIKVDNRLIKIIKSN